MKNFQLNSSKDVLHHNKIMLKIALCWNYFSIHFDCGLKMQNLVSGNLKFFFFDFLILGRKEGVKKNTKISIFLDAIASLPRFGV